MCLDIIVLVVIMYTQFWGVIKAPFVAKITKRNWVLLQLHITFILFLVGVDYVLVTQTLVKEVRTRYLANTMLVG